MGCQTQCSQRKPECGIDGTASGRMFTSIAQARRQRLIISSRTTTNKVNKHTEKKYTYFILTKEKSSSVFTVQASWFCILV